MVFHLFLGVDGVFGDKIGTFVAVFAGVVGVFEAGVFPRILGTIKAFAVGVLAGTREVKGGLPEVLKDGINEVLSAGSVDAKGEESEMRLGETRTGTGLDIGGIARSFDDSALDTFETDLIGDLKVKCCESEIKKNYFGQSSENR